MFKPVVLFLIAFSASTSAQACQYGTRWYDAAATAIIEAYGHDASDIHVDKLIDKSKFIFTRSTGANCPDYLRAVVKLTFKFEGQSCKARVIVKELDEHKLGRVKCRS